MDKNTQNITAWIIESINLVYIYDIDDLVNYSDLFTSFNLTNNMKTAYGH